MSNEPAGAATVNLLDGTALSNLGAAGAVDVIVVGGGGAGAVVALEAAERGASVLVLERRDQLGGNTVQSGGSIRAISDAEGATEHFHALAQGATPRAVIAAFVGALAEVPEWLSRHGADLGASGGAGAVAVSRMLFPAGRTGSTFPEFPGADAVRGRVYVAPRRPGREAGAALWDLLEDELATLQIPVVVGAAVDRLLVDEHTRGVVGVEVRHTGGRSRVLARHAVVLACGGFAYDRERLVQSVGIALPSVSAPDVAIGDGIRLALDAGADLWHMSALSTSLGYQFDGYEAAFYCELRDRGFVLVDQEARRYVAETSLENHGAVHAMLAQDPYSGRFLRVPSFVVFDETTRRSGPVIRQPNGANRDVAWSADNAAEVARGWIRSAASLAELAEMLGLPGDALEATVAVFNEHASAGETDPFGRAPSQMRPLTGPPYYGIPVYPVILNTQGGPRRDERGRILRPDGSPIPGLYGAGELGSIWSRLYPGTGNVSECLASGLIAARDIVSVP